MCFIQSFFCRKASKLSYICISNKGLIFNLSEKNSYDNSGENIKTLVGAGIITIDLPKMGGITIINGVVFDSKTYYKGRGQKHNKNINHERVVVKITRKELAKAMRHYKVSMKVKALCREANAKNKRKSYNPYFWVTNKNMLTKKKKLYFPEIKEISRDKIH